MNNELIPAKGLWCKIKRFFKSLFLKEKNYNKNKDYVLETNQISNNFTPNYNLKEKFEKDNVKQVLAEKLLYGEIGISELNEIEVDEMTEYFKKDIENLDNELSRIKQHILSMQQQLKQ